MGAVGGGGYALNAGAVLGQYRIVWPLGKGGMGQVYEVEHTTLGRRYALKLLPEDFVRSPNALERFKREAKVMANLEHPHIIRVDEFGETDGRYWLRMELAGGLRPAENGGQRTEDGLVTLADLAKANAGKLPQETLLPILKQVLDGLAYAHARGAVHRDLKPSNILLTTNHTNAHEKAASAEKKCIAKIADFGLVKLVGEEWVKSMVELSVQRSMSMGDERTVAGDSAGTSTQSLLGTYEYMSPEQKRGEEADARSDIYSVGLMIYKLLTGEELGMRTPSQLDLSLDKGWDELVLKCLESKTERRFQSVNELGSQLSEIRCQKPDGDVFDPKTHESHAKEADHECTRINTNEKRWSGLSEHATEKPREESVPLPPSIKSQLLFSVKMGGVAVILFFLGIVVPFMASFNPIEVFGLGVIMAVVTVFIVAAMLKKHVLKFKGGRI